MSAVLNGNELTLFGIDGAPAEGVVLNIGVELNSIAFIPEVMSSEVAYPTTSEQVYHIESFYEEGYYLTTASNQILKPLSYDKSSKFALRYRLNPSNANTDAIADWSFINRSVTTRAIAGDAQNLLNKVEDSEVINGGELTLTATLNNSKLSLGAKDDIVALQAWVGTTPVTSDYIHVSSKGVTVDILNSKTNKEYYNREINGYLAGNAYTAKGAESDAFIKQFVDLTADANLYLMYLEPIDLNEYVKVRFMDNATEVPATKFDGINFKFYLPENYNANDNQKTNQQWFVALDENGVLSATQGTASIGRTPVVRVDAFIADNYGVERLVASSYIKIEVTEKPVDPAKDKTDNPINLNTQSFIYQNLAAAYLPVNVMDYTKVNSELYKVENLTAETFWNHYGNGNGEFSIEVKKNNASYIPSTTKQGQSASIEDKGIQVVVDLNSTNTTTSRIAINVNNEIETTHATPVEYMVVITIPSNNKKLNGDFVITQVFTVAEECVDFTYNSDYYVAAGNRVEVKGDDSGANGTWVMSTDIAEHFVLENQKDIFTYAMNRSNVTSISFAIDAAYSNVAVQSGNIITLKNALTEAYKDVKVNYTVTLANNTTCKYSYYVRFINPFVDGAHKGISVDDNIGDNIAYVDEALLVKDTYNNVIYSWENNALTLSSRAIETYHLSAPDVTYAIKDDAAYKEFLTNHKADELTISEDADGRIVVNYHNGGTSLVKDLNLTIVATVTFTGISSVDCEIPFTIKQIK